MGTFTTLLWDLGVLLLTPTTPNEYFIASLTGDSFPRLAHPLAPSSNSLSILSFLSRKLLLLFSSNTDLRDLTTDENSSVSLRLRYREVLA